MNTQINLQEMVRRERALEILGLSKKKFKNGGMK